MPRYQALDGAWRRPSRPLLAPAGDPAWREGWGHPSWRDDFDYRDANGQPAVDPAKWNVRTRVDIGLLPDIAEPMASQVTVSEEGILRIRAEWLDTPYPRPYEGNSPITMKTGYMDHRELFPGNVAISQVYGRWEIRCKVPTGPKTYGSLAAFWLRQTGRSGELDIMESWGFNEGPRNADQKIGTSRTTILKDTMGGTTKSYWHDRYGGKNPNWEDFHTYAWEYTPTWAAAYMDDKRLFTLTPADVPELWDTRYFGLPQHLRMNLHMGMNATFYGIPDPAKPDETVTPLDYLVDYVRIWPYQGA